MVVSMAGMSTIFTSVQNTVKTSSGSAINIVICLVTVGSEQLFSFAAFNCPCPQKTNGTSTPVQQNHLYGWVFIIVPAMALFTLGYAMNIKTWKLMTGCCRRSNEAARGYRAGCITILEIFVQALVAPLAWMAVAFLDGKYYACAASEDPYVNTCVDVLTRKLTATTAEYESNKRDSQIIGWSLIASTLFLGSVFYMIHRCLSPLTYHHRKYARWYRELESEAFEKKAKEQIKAEVENETVARFLQYKRNKDNWDKISTVFNFTRDENNYALYSRLDQWNVDNEEEEVVKTTVPGPPMVEDESSLETTPPQNNQPKTLEKAEKCVGNETETKHINQEIPKLPPPPSNKNEGKRRRSSLGFEDNYSGSRPPTSISSEQPTAMTSPIRADMTSQKLEGITQPKTAHRAPQNDEIELKTRHSNHDWPYQSHYKTSRMTSDTEPLMTPENDDTHDSAGINTKCKSMPNIYTDTKSKLENGKVQIKPVNATTFIDDGDDVIT